jgi:hypothetical protein
LSILVDVELRYSVKVFWLVLCVLY